MVTHRLGAVRTMPWTLGRTVPTASQGSGCRLSFKYVMVEAVTMSPPSLERHASPSKKYAKFSSHIPSIVNALAC
jgi:hypothetical protein